MLIKDTIAPSQAELRPLESAFDATFPVYLNLTTDLVEAPKHPNNTVAHVMAICAGYAYSDSDTLVTIMARMGLVDNACRTISESVDALFISSTAHVIQSNDGRVVIVAYRGTDPTSSHKWLTYDDLYAGRVALSPGDLPVHEGFYRNVSATRSAVVTTLAHAAAGRSIVEPHHFMENGMEALYITGHGLGGAVAVLMAVMLRTRPAYARLAGTLRAVYTFGQPMVGTPSFAKACTENTFLRENVIRYIYRHDVVSRLPPKVSGPFAHFGREYRYEGTDEAACWRHKNRPRRQASTLQVKLNLEGVVAAAGLVVTPLAVAAPLLRMFRIVRSRNTLDDHSPSHYIFALTPPGVRSEFGD